MVHPAANIDSSRVWDAIAECVDRFLSDCEIGGPIPDVLPYLPPTLGSAKTLALIELIKVHLEQRCRLGERPSLNEYMAQFPELSRCTGGAPFDLILDAVQLAKKNGDDAEIAHYIKTFPAHAERLQKLLSFANSPISTYSVWRCPVQDITPGQRLEDFEVIRLLGHGAFARVFLAYQQTMGRVVAVKISADRGDEPKTLARLDHPHIIRVYDVRRLTEPPARLLSMQFAPGGTLQQVIERLSSCPHSKLAGASLIKAIDSELAVAANPPPEESPRRERLWAATWCETVSDIGIQLAQALAYAHRLNVLHRDVKPANVLLTAEAVCKLADFNVSFSGDVSSSHPSSYFGGSLLYMSPEQMRATQLGSGVSPSDLDGRSDVFSLCTVLWELLTLQKPWPADESGADWDSTIENLLHNRITRSPVVPETMLQTADILRLVDVLRKGLVHEREHRIGSAEELAGQLRLSQIPQAWGIFHPEQNLWRRIACRFPWLCAAMIIFVPHALAGIFNYEYNLSWILREHLDGFEHFRAASIAVNIFAFGGGGFIYAMVFGKIAKEVRQRYADPQRNLSQNLANLLTLPLKVAFFGLALWLAAGVVFPLLLTLLIPGFDVTAVIHFFASLLICGAIVFAYPFLGTCLMVLEAWYGTLIGRELKDQHLHRGLSKILSFANRILLVTAGVPLLGIAMLLMQSTPAKLPLIGLVTVGGVGLFASYVVQQRISSAIGWLRAVVSS